MMKQGDPTPIVCFPMVNEERNIDTQYTIIPLMVKRIIFAGNNQIAVDILRFLKKQKGVEIIALVVHPRRFAKKRNVLVKTSGLNPRHIVPGDGLNDSSTIDALRRLKPDLFLSINFRYLLKTPVIALPKLGCINLHFGYLPWNRGVFADAWSIIEGTPAGVTYHLIDSGIDTGAIVSQRKVEEELTDTGKTLYQKLTNAAYDLFVDTWPSIRRWNFNVRKQMKDGSFHRRSEIEPIDRIDVRKMYRAGDLINILRARTFPPYDGAYITTTNGKKIYLRLQLYEKTKT